MSSPDAEDHAPSFIARTQSGIYDSITEQLLALPPGVLLAQASYHINFKREVNTFNGNFSYIQPLTGAEYETIFVGQVAQDEKFRACGTHYAGTANNPRPITDKTPVKGLFTLCKPALASQKLKILYDNQIATLCEITDAHGEEATRKKQASNLYGRYFVWDVKDWTESSYSNESGVPDSIVVHTEPLYTIAKSAVAQRGSKRVRMTKTHIAPHVKETKKDSVEPIGDDMHMADGDTKVDEVTKEANTKPERTTSDVYDPHVLPDYGGDIFQHQEARLRQLDIRDADNELIPPQDWYNNLHSGALVLISGTLHTFNMENNRRIYHIHAHTIRIVDKAGHPIQPRVRLLLPGEEASGTYSTAHSLGATQIGSFQVLGKHVRD